MGPQSLIVGSTAKNQSVAGQQNNAWLWRRLMGSVVLDAGTAPQSVYLYAHCLRDHPGGVALLALNLSDRPAILAIQGSRGTVYALTAPSLDSGTVMLNDNPLALSVKGELPQLSGVPLRSSRARLSPESIEFISIPEAHNAACYDPR